MAKAIASFASGSTPNSAVVVMRQFGRKASSWTINWPIVHSTARSDDFVCVGREAFDAHGDGGGGEYGGGCDQVFDGSPVSRNLRYELPSVLLTAGGFRRRGGVVRDP